MENTIENAQEFLRNLDETSGTIWTESDEDIVLAFVTYANSARPEVKAKDAEIEKWKKDHKDLLDLYIKADDELTEAKKRIEELETKNSLLDILNHTNGMNIRLLESKLREAEDEREVMIQAFDKFRQQFEGRKWIMHGRGEYPYNDDRYKQEVRFMYDEFDAIVKDMWSGIKSKTYEYRNQVEKPLLDKLKESEERIRELEQCIESIQNPIY